jgi:hypothetical protein
MRDTTSDPVIAARAIVQAAIAQKVIARPRPCKLETSPRIVALLLILWAISIIVLISWFAYAT